VSTESDISVAVKEICELYTQAPAGPWEFRTDTNEGVIIATESSQYICKLLHWQDAATKHAGLRLIVAMHNAMPELLAELERALGQEAQTAAMAGDLIFEVGAADHARVPTELFCPECKHQHVDKDEGDIDWTVRPHKKHLCAACKHIWKPYPVGTVGVDFHAQCRAAREACDLAVAQLRQQAADQARLIAENEQLTKRRDELLQLVVKMTREEPQSGELEECKAGRAALIAEVGSLRSELMERNAIVEEMQIELIEVRAQADLLRVRTEYAEQDVARTYLIEHEANLRGREQREYLCESGAMSCVNAQKLKDEIDRLKPFEKMHEAVELLRYCRPFLPGGSALRTNARIDELLAIMTEKP